MKEKKFIPFFVCNAINIIYYKIKTERLGMKEKKLIVLEQLPVIRSALENLSVEIKEKVDNAINLVCNENTIQDVKKTRAELNKEFNELETQRKEVKNAILSKYNEFEEIYRENVSNLYKDADEQLKEKIDAVENNLKVEKELELREFFKQHCETNDIDFLTFENVGLNITLSASMKSLKEQIIDFINKVLGDLKLIGLEEYKEEIMIEYMNNLDFVKSKVNVVERHKRLEELIETSKKLEERNKQENKMVEKVEELITPPKEIIEDEDIVKVQFTIETTKSNIVELKKWLNERNIKYE